MRWLLSLLLALVAALASTYPAQPLPRHVNPDEVAPSLDPLALSQVYAELANLLRGENFSGFLQLNQHLMQISAPGDVTFILSRFHELSLQQGLLLNYTREALKMAESQLRVGDLEGALDLLGEVVRTLARVNATYVGLADAAEALQRRVKATPAPLLEAIRALIQAYHLKAYELNETLHANLTRTLLTLKCASDSAWVGSTVAVYGSLTTEAGFPLPQREIILLCDGRACGKTLTDSEGNYHLSISVPYVYVEYITLIALYEPSGSDALTFRPAVSEPLRLNLLYFTPQVNVTVSPSVATPTSRVKVLAETNLYGAELALWGLGQALRADAEGGIALWELAVPPDAGEGVYTLRVCTVPRGVYGPGCGAATLLVRKLSLLVALEAPRVLVTAVPFTVKVSLTGEDGKLPRALELFMSIPEAGLAVAQNLSAVYTPIELQGSLSILAPGGRAKLVVTAVPRDPVYSSGGAEAEVYVVNPVLLAVSAVLAGSVFAVYRRVSSRSKRLGSPQEPAEASPSVPVAEAPQPAVAEPEKVEAAEETPPTAEVAVSDPVVGEYMRAVAFVEKATGIRMEPSHTISEYLNLVTPRLGSKAVYFEQISRLAEARLYADAKVDPEYAKSLRLELEKSEG